MQYEWDEAKRLKVLEKHGIDFRRAKEVFEGDYVTTPARHEGEARTWAIGPVEGVLVAVCFTMRGEVCRLITARRARRNERRAHLSRHSGADPQAQG
jgi:uncharacterized DUF497 family protein